MSEKTKNLGIRATEERQRELKHLAADRGVSVQRLIEDAINAVYFGTQKPGITDLKAVIPSEHVELAADLIAILKSPPPGPEFLALQSTVEIAIREYRERYKGKEKTSNKGSDHRREKAG